MKCKFTEVYHYEKGFAEYFETKLLPLLHKVEKHRQATMQKLIFATIACIVLTVLVTIFFAIHGEEGDEAYGAVFFGVIISCFVLGMIIKGFEDKAKSKINEIMVRFFGAFDYKHNYGISEQKIDEIDFILPDYDYIDYEDYIKGNYNDSIIEFCEARVVEEWEDSDGDDHEKTVFKGLFVIITLQKYFQGKTFITKDKGLIGNFFRNCSKEKDFIKLPVKNREFELRHEVYSNNPAETLALLTPGLQNSILKLAKNFGSSSLNCCFYCNWVFFAIPVSKNLFESASLFKSAYNEYQFKNFLRDFNLVLNLADLISWQLRDREVENQADSNINSGTQEASL